MPANLAINSVPAVKRDAEGRSSSSLAWLYPAALWISLAIQIAHIISVPLLITFDGHWYIRLAEVLGTSRFAAEWDYLRTPLYPALLKIAFLVFGQQALAVVLIQSALVSIGIWMLSRMLRRMGRPVESAIVLVVLSAYPTLVAYEHALLTEAGTFFFVAALAYILSLPSRRPVLYVSALTGLISLGFYYRSSLVLLAPLAAVLYAWASLRELSDSPTRKPRRAQIRIAWRALAIAFVPFLIAYPWQRNPKAQARNQVVIVYGLVKQAVIPPEDPRWGAAADRDRKAIEASSIKGRLPVSGLQNGHEYEMIGAFHPGESTPQALLVQAVMSYPGRYFAGVGRNLLLFAGLGRFESDSAYYRTVILRSPGTAIEPAPQGFRSIDAQFAHAAGSSLVRGFFVDAAPLYDFVIFLAFCATVGVLTIGLWRKDMTMIKLAALPLGFIVIQALVLSSQDRMVLPVYPLLLVNLVLLPDWLWQRVKLYDTAGDRAFPVLDRFAFRGALILIGFLAVCHVAYALESRMIPSADEAHYMSGVYSIAGGLRSGSLKTAFLSFAGALGFKAPLICVPAAFLMLAVGEVVLASKLSLVLIFIGVGLASYSLFRNLFQPTLAAFATALTLTAPIVTGLSHRFYVENLLLLITIVYADLLIRRRLDSFTGAALLGVVFGFGLLAKILTVPLLAIPTLYTAYLSYRSARGGGQVRAAALVAARLAALVAVAAPIAYTWWGFYSHVAVVDEFAGAAAACDLCFYPSVYAAFANFSSGPYFFVFFIAMAGLARFSKWLRASGTAPARIHAWLVILLIGIFIPIANAGGPTKTVRYIAMTVPGIAALAVFTATAWFRSDRQLIRALAVIVGVSVLLVLHNSFDILPFESLRISDLRLIDDRYPLNIPDWFDDNHPVDRRDFRVAEAAELFERDFRSLARPGERADVRLIVHGLLIDHDYLNLLSMVRGYPLDFHPGWISPSVPPDQYILSCSGCGSVYPGRHYLEFGPSQADLESGKLPYDRMFQLQAPAGVVLTGFRRRRIEAQAASVAGLKLIDSPTLGFIDRVNATASPGASELHVSRRFPLRITGWAVDAPNGTAAGAVYIDIDGSAFQAAYGVPRPDVATAFRNPNYGHSGYTADLPVDQFFPGQHKLTVKILNAGKTGYYLGKTLTFTLD